MGLSLVGMAFVGVGLFCSCLLRNQVVAALLVLLVLGVSIFLGDIVSFVGVTGERVVGGPMGPGKSEGSSVESGGNVRQPDDGDVCSADPALSFVQLAIVIL